MSARTFPLATLVVTIILFCLPTAASAHHREGHDNAPKTPPEAAQKNSQGKYPGSQGKANAYGKSKDKSQGQGASEGKAHGKDEPHPFDPRDSDPDPDPDPEPDPVVAAPTGLSCEYHVGRLDLFTPELMFWTWNDVSTAEAGYQVRSVQLGLPEQTVTVYDLGIDASSFAFLTTDFVTERVDQVAAVAADGTRYAVDVDPIACTEAGATSLAADITATPGPSAGVIDIAWPTPGYADAVDGYEVVLWPDTNPISFSMTGDQYALSVGGLTSGEVVSVAVETCYSFATWCAEFHNRASVTVP